MVKPVTEHIFLVAFLLLTFQLPAIFFSENIEGQEVAVDEVMLPPVEVQAIVTGSLPQVNAGYCQLGQSTVTFTNLGMSGTPAESIITDLTLGIALGENFLLLDNAFEVTGIRIAGVNLSSFSPMNLLNNNPQFSTDPDGAGGLSDTDGDGFFDDLELGSSVEVTAFYRFDCSQATSTNSNCLNNYSTEVSARMGYLEQGAPQMFELEDYLKPSNLTTEFENRSDPDAFLGVDTFYVSHRNSRSVRFFDFDCGGVGELVARVALPTGYTPIISSTVFLKNEVDTIPLISAQVINDTLVLTYDANAATSLSGDYELRLALFGDCFVLTGPSSFPFSLAHYCPSCDCSHTWYCGDLPGPQLHVTLPPCPIEVLPPCDKGVKTLSFEVERSTFGFADEDFTIPFSPQAANKKVALSCDSVRMHLVSTVGTTAVADSIGIVVTYGNPNGSTNIAETFLFHRGMVRFTHLGNEFNCSVSPDDLTVTDNAGDKTLTFDLNDCLIGLGFSLTADDTIEFTGEFVVNPDGPFGSDFSLVPNLRGFAFAELSGQQFACDNFGDNFSVGKSRAIFDFPNSAAGQPQGCDDADFHFRLFVPDNDFSDYFGNEFRAANKIDSFTLSFDPQLLSIYANSEVMVSIPGHPIYGDDYFPIRPLTDFPDGNYVATFDTLNYVPSLNLVEEYTFDLMLRLTPSCIAAVEDDFELTSQIYFQDRYYASTIGDGSCVEQNSENGNSTIIYTAPPVITFSNLSPTIDTVQGGTAEWQVQICNSSPSANALVTWIAVENSGGELTISGITNITDPGSPSPLLLFPYPSGSFSFMPALAPGACLDVLIEASSNECGDIDFDLLSGWNCGPFIQSNWNPSLNAPCEEATMSLGLVNQLNAPLSIDLQQVTSSCDGGGGELVTINGQLTSALNILVDDFTITFIYDENGDGSPQITEPILAQQTISGSISAGSPLLFGETFLATPEQACNVLVEVTAAATELCNGLLIQLPVPQLINAGENQIFCNFDSPILNTTLGDANCNGLGYQYTWAALPPANSNDISDLNSAQPILNLDWSNYLGQTLSFVLETERIACGNSTFDTINISLPNAAFGFFETDSITLQAPDCQTLVELCLPVTNDQLPNLEVTDNGLPYPPGAFTTCQDSLNALQLGNGTHELIATDLVTGCSDTVVVTVRCATTETIVIDILLHTSDTICFSDDEIFGAIQTLDNLCEDGSFVEYELFQDSCLILTGNWVGTENACILACDNVGFCDTTLLQINVTHPFPDGIKDSIVIEQLASFCFDETMLNIAGEIEMIENICPDQSGTSVNYSIEQATDCVFYFGTDLGVDTACIRICDALGYCDTINVCVSVIPGDVFYDTIFIEVDTNVFCLSDSLLPGDIIMVEDICPDDNGDEVQFSINGNCISYWGDVVGQDTACIRFEDEFGNVGLTNLIVTVVRTIPATICDSVFIGEIHTICLDTLELPGNYSYIEEICPDVRTGNTDIFIDPVTLCVDYEGLVEGPDSACIVVCDDFGFCDTTYLCLTVAPFFDLPTLGNDTTTTEKGTPVVIDFLANDTLYGGITEIFILTPPISGTATLNLQNSFTYIPDEEFCSRWDNFTYVACNPNGCDTATVSIFIECINLTVFSAVSPNNDGVNDFFYIAKIDDFPDNHLWVYNRWGNLVFEKTQYKNTWPGSWGEDIDLPDGTYYYILEWSDGGTETIQRGYFEMFR